MTIVGENNTRYNARSDGQPVAKTALGTLK